MANPVIVNIPLKTWTLAAAGIQAGTISRLNSEVVYYQTYRDAGDPAPTDSPGSDLPAEAVTMFSEHNQAAIAAAAPVDVYLWCEGITGRQGSVRIDL